jgi:hypothetical protein
VAADPVTGLDGTQEPPAPAWLSDPLAGLLTGASPLEEVKVPRVAAPALPDAKQIREALEEVLDQPPRRPLLRPPPTITQTPAPGIVRPTRQWPSAASVARKLRATRDLPPKVHKPEPPLPGPPREPAGLRTGMSVVAVIVLVTVVILFYVVRSLADTFGQLFG